MGYNCTIIHNYSTAGLQTVLSLLWNVNTSCACCHFHSLPPSPPFHQAAQFILFQLPELELFLKEFDEEDAKQVDKVKQKWVQQTHMYHPSPLIHVLLDYATHKHL